MVPVGRHPSSQYYLLNRRLRLPLKHPPKKLHQMAIMFYDPYKAKKVTQAIGGIMVGSQFPQKQSMAVRKGRITVAGTKKKTKSASNSVKQIMLRSIDSHHSTISDNVNIISGAGFKHNTMYTANITAAVTQGTTNANRLGDKIHLEKLIIEGIFAAPTTAGAYNYRIIVCWSGNEYNPTGLGSAFGTYADIFLPNTGSSFLTNGIINPKGPTVLWDSRYDINSAISTTADIVTYRKTISLNQDFAYESTGATYGKYKNLYVIVIGCVIGGATGTTEVGNAAFASDLVFKPL